MENVILRPFPTFTSLILCGNLTDCDPHQYHDLGLEIINIKKSVIIDCFLLDAIGLEWLSFFSFLKQQLKGLKRDLLVIHLSEEESLKFEEMEDLLSPNFLTSMDYFQNVYRPRGVTSPVQGIFLSVMRYFFEKKDYLSTRGKVSFVDSKYEPQAEYSGGQQITVNAFDKTYWVSLYFEKKLLQSVDVPINGTEALEGEAMAMLSTIGEQIFNLCKEVYPDILINNRLSRPYNNPEHLDPHLDKGALALKKILLPIETGHGEIRIEICFPGGTTIYDMQELILS